MFTDKTGREILGGDILFNPHDAEVDGYMVLEDESGMLYLGDFGSPLDRFRPEEFWTITNR